MTNEDWVASLGIARGWLLSILPLVIPVNFNFHILLMICCLAFPEADPYFTVKLHDKTGVEKDEIILKCEVSKDVPVRWFKDGEEIVPSTKHSIKTDGLRRILKIKKAELKDKGEYMCDCGTDQTKANLNVEGELL